MKWKRTSLIGAGALVALVVATACGSDDSGTGQQASQTAATSAPSVTTSAAAQDQHNDADVMFAQHMIPHHQQAIEMSDILLAKQGIDPRIVDLANQIKAAQAPEIQQLQQWLSEWGNPPMPAMPAEDSGMQGHGDMPGMSSGMMTEQDLAALTNAQGVEAGKLFLTQMIEHHKGAITMGQNEIKDGKFAPAVAMARSIVATQQQEIDKMNGILSTL